MAKKKDFSDIRAIIKEKALSCLEAPYVYGAKRWGEATNHDFPENFDCSSFVHALYRFVFIHIPMRSLEQACIGREVTGALEIGDLLFFRSDTGFYNPEWPNGIGHVVMYIGKVEGHRYPMVIGACGTFPYKRKRVDKVILMPLKFVIKREDFRATKRILGYV